MPLRFSDRFGIHDRIRLQLSGRLYLVLSLSLIFKSKLNAAWERKVQFCKHRSVLASTIKYCAHCRRFDLIRRLSRICSSEKDSKGHIDRVVFN